MGLNGARMQPVSSLLEMFWTIKTVDYVPVTEKLVQKCKTKFCQAFTKLRAWQQVGAHGWGGS